MNPFQGKGIVKSVQISVRNHLDVVIAMVALAVAATIVGGAFLPGMGSEFSRPLSVIEVVLLVIVICFSLYGHRGRASDKKEIERLIQASGPHEKYEVSVEKSNDVAYVISGNKITFGNKYVMDQLGYSPEEVSGLDFYELVAPEGMGVIKKRVENSGLGDEIESRFGFKAIAKDGRKIPLEVTETFVRRHDEVQTIRIIRDMNTFNEQKLLYEELFKNAPIGLGIYKDFKAVRVNNAGADMLGYSSPDEMTGSHIFEFVHPEDHSTVKERVKQAMLDRVPAFPMEEKFLRKDGSSIHVLVLSQPVMYEGEDAVQIAFVSLEDRKKLEENLALETSRQEEEKVMLDTLLQSLGEGIMFQNTDGKIEFANEEFCRIFGFQNSGLVTGRQSKDVAIQVAHMTKFPDEFVDRINHDVEEKAAVKMLRLEMADGSIIERSAFPLFDSTQKYVGRLAVFRDITTKEKNEEAIKRLQRTELLGRLAGGVAHDFNNVLGVIMASLQLILQKTDDPKVVQENTKRALSSAIRGSEVAKRLLQFVRYSPEGFRVFSVRQTIEETVTIVKHTFEKNIDIHEEFVIRDASVYGSPRDIQQVLINLANNSRDSMPDGGDLTFSLTTADTAQVEKKLGSPTTNQYVLLMIQDSGRGIEADKLEKIFDPFFTTKEPGKGTGLGLSIVQTIISAHGGFVDVKSRAGAGTAFFIYLPMSKEQRDQTVPAIEEDTGESVESGKPKTILVVEDEPDLRELVSRFLSDKGFNVISAGDGEEGYRAFENHPDISVVLSDLGLPKTAGDQLIIKIKNLRPEVRCILATGYLTPAADDVLSKMGVKTVMKPYNLMAIYKLVAEDS
jgi:PAS domain S-box-containing protein